MYSFDKKTLFIILLIMAISSIVGGQRTIEGIIYSLPGVIVAMTFHEFAHAWAATKLGDDTPRLEGRLNLNPLSHIDPIGLLCLIFLGFGWGKPVEINPRNFDGKYSLSKAEAIVAAAGPIMNFILALLFIIIYAIIIKLNLSFNTWYIISRLFMSIILVNISLGVFNLIPIYPLDGSKVLNHFLPYKAREWIANNNFILTIALFVIVYFTDLTSYISLFIYNGMISLVSLLFGL